MSDNAAFVCVFALAVIVIIAQYVTTVKLSKLKREIADEDARVTEAD